MDAGADETVNQQVVRVDLNGFDLPVIAANAQELASHEDVLVQLDKSSGGKTLWRKAV
jgi:DNA polymerase-3 subunit epsilon